MAALDRDDAQLRGGGFGGSASTRRFGRRIRDGRRGLAASVEHQHRAGADERLPQRLDACGSRVERQPRRAAAQLHARAARPNLFIKIPGTPQGLPAIEQSIFDGVPINVTLLFSREQYLACVEAYTRGIERRVAAGLDPFVCSVASVFLFVSLRTAFCPSSRREPRPTR